MSAAEMATVYVGRCPACGDFPDGEWIDGSEWKHWCGYHIRATCTYDKRAAIHWVFDFGDVYEERRFKRNRAQRLRRRPPRKEAGKR